MIAFDNEYEQLKRDVAKLERLHAQMTGRKKEILRRLRAFGIKTLKEGIAAKKEGLSLELAAAEKWDMAMEEFKPVYKRIKELLRRAE